MDISNWPLYPVIRLDFGKANNSKGIRQTSEGTFILEVNYNLNKDCLDNVSLWKIQNNEIYIDFLKGSLSFYDTSQLEVKFLFHSLVKIHRPNMHCSFKPEKFCLTLLGIKIKRNSNIHFITRLICQHLLRLIVTLKIFLSLKFQYFQNM